MTKSAGGLASDAPPDPLSSIGHETAAAVAALGAEIRLAGISAGGILALGVFSGVAALGAWLLVIVSAALFLERFGLPWELTVLILAFAHGALALVAWQKALRLAENLRVGGFLDGS